MKLGSIAATLGCVVIGLPVAIILLLGGGDTPCGAAASGPAPSAAAANAIPANYLALYQAAGEKYDIPWNLIAAIGSNETDHGRSTLPGVSSGANSAGAGGPMQFLQGTFDHYGVDGNNDAHKSRYDPRDAIPSAANYLKASGAPGDLHRAIFAYNHSEAYVQAVLATMRQYAGTAPSAPAAGTLTAGAPSADTAGAGTPTGNCDDLGGLTAGTGDGRFSIAPRANKPDQPLTADLTMFISRMATFYDGTLVLTTGTNHDQFTQGGNVSDHFTGNAADFGMLLNHGTNDGPVGDAIAASAFLAAGLPHDQAVSRARAGGARTILSNGLRIQIIWKIDTPTIGNHHNHVHVGIARIR